MILILTSRWVIFRVLTNPLALPEGTQILSAERSGVSAWTKTAKLSVLTPDGDEKKYFLKVRNLCLYHRSILIGLR